MANRPERVDIHLTLATVFSCQVKCINGDGTPIDFTDIANTSTLSIKENWEDTEALWELSKANGDITVDPDDDSNLLIKIVVPNDGTFPSVDKKYVYTWNIQLGADVYPLLRGLVTVGY